MNERIALLEGLGFDPIRDGSSHETELEFSVVSNAAVAEIIATVKTYSTRLEVTPERMGPSWTVEVSFDAPAFVLRQVAEAAMATIGA